MRGGDLFKPKKRAKPIPKVSKKRKLTLPQYKEITQKLWDDAVKNGTNYCIFCGEEMEKKEDAHHLKGRDGYLFVDPEWLALAHNNCHFWKYHKMSIAELLNEPWYPGFLVRLKEIDEGLWRKELKKQEKAQLNLDIF